MSHVDTIQACLDLFRQPRYLEIGVQNGVTFHALKAHHKVAVDPNFLFDVTQAGNESPNSTYCEVFSDDFFGAYSGECFDVIFIDGLHTAEQTLRDLLNALTFSKANSVIIIDDILPSSYPASLPNDEDTVFMRGALGSTDNSWMGDVYRVVYFIDTMLQQYSYATPTNGNPQLVMWREARKSVPRRTLAQIGLADFLSIHRDRSMLKELPLDAVIKQASTAGVGDRNPLTPY